MDPISIAHYSTITRWESSFYLVMCATAVLLVFQSYRVLQRQEHKRLTRPRYALLRCHSRTHSSLSQSRIPRIAITSSSPSRVPRNPAEGRFYG